MTMDVEYGDDQIKITVKADHQFGRTIISMLRKFFFDRAVTSSPSSPPSSPPLIQDPVVS